MVAMCLANRLAGRTESMPRNVALASVPASPMRASSRPHAGAHVDGSDNTGRGPTAVEDAISSSCRPSRRTTQTRAPCCRGGAAGSSVRRRLWGQPRGGGGRGGDPPEDPQKQEARSDGHHGGGVDGTSWGGRRNESASTASQPARMGYVAGWWGGAAELSVAKGGGEPPGADRSKERRAPRGRGGRHVVGWAEERVGEHRVATSAEGYVVGWRGGVVESPVWGGVSPGCACGPTGRGVASVCLGGRGGREAPVRAARHATPVSRGADPVRGPTSTTPLGRGSGGGGGCGRHPAGGPGWNPLLRGRRGTGENATSRNEGAVWRSRVAQSEGAWPLSCTQHTPGGRPKISRSGPARE